MRLSFQIAWRYLFSKKTVNAINIISAVSMLGMLVGAFALIVVLSVFNGFEDLVKSLYNSFYPDIEITAAKGKTFLVTDSLEIFLKGENEIEHYTKCLQENAYIKYGEKDFIATLKGVDEKYAQVTDVKKFVKAGDFTLHDSLFHYAVFGANIYDALQINVQNSYLPLQITIPKKGLQTTLIPEESFSTGDLVPVGVFAIQQEFDSKYVFTSLDFVQQLADEENRVSSIELKLPAHADLEKWKEIWAKKLGKDFQLKTKYEQKQSLYKVMRLERWAVYAILSFIMVVISFNIIGSLFMLVMEKRRDISILKALGMHPNYIKRIFLFEGSLVALLGALVGMFLALIVCLLQIKYGFIKLNTGGGSFVVDSYPVQLRFSDFVITFFTVIIISLAASYFPSSKSVDGNMDFKPI